MQMTMARDVYCACEGEELVGREERVAKAEQHTIYSVGTLLLAPHRRLLFVLLFSFYFFVADTSLLYLELSDHRGMQCAVVRIISGRRWVEFLRLVWQYDIGSPICIDSELAVRLA